MFKFQFTGDLAGKFELATQAVDHLPEALRQFGKYLRDKAKQKFSQEGPGWASLAKSTDKRLVHSFTGKFTVMGKLRKSSVQGLKAQIERGISKGKVPLAARSKLNAIIAGNLGDDSRALRAFGFIQRKKKAKEMNAAEKIEVKLEKLKKQSKDERAQSLSKTRAVTKHKLLGKLSSSIRARVTGNTLEVFSIVPWSNVHNEGGSAGKGARIPKREFLALDEKDLDVLATLVEGQLTESL